MSKLWLGGLTDSARMEYRMTRLRQRSINFLVSLTRMVLLLAVSFIILYPLFVKISLSFMTVDDLYDASVVFIPRNATLLNYTVAAERVSYIFTLLKTTAFIVILSLLQVFASLLTGYGFARFRFKFKQFWFACAVLTLIIPAQNIMAPLYTYFMNFNLLGILGNKGINLLDTPWPMVLLSATCMGMKNCLYIYMFKQYFSGFPKELEESGRIDGANNMTIFLKIVLPCSGAMSMTCFLFSFVWQWTDTFYLNVFMPNSSFLATKLEGLPKAIGNADPHYQAIMSNISVLMLIVPLLFLFMLTQRSFIETIERSGIVG